MYLCGTWPGLWSRHIKICQFNIYYTGQTDTTSLSPTILNTLRIMKVGAQIPVLTMGSSLIEKLPHPTSGIFLLQDEIAKLDRTKLIQLSDRI